MKKETIKAIKSITKAAGNKYRPAMQYAHVVDSVLYCTDGNRMLVAQSVQETATIDSNGATVLPYDGDLPQFKSVVPTSAPMVWVQRPQLPKLSGPAAKQPIVTIDLKGEQFAMNLGYFVEACEYFTRSELFISYDGPNKPIIISDNEDYTGSDFWVIMPVRGEWSTLTIKLDQ